MRDHEHPPYPTVDSLAEVQLQVCAEDDLNDHHEHQDVGERGVDVLGELSALVRVAEEVCHYCDHGADYLDRNVPTGSDDLNGSVREEEGALSQEKWWHTPRTIPRG